MTVQIFVSEDSQWKSIWLKWHLKRLLTCVHNHQGWWWGWPAWPTGTQSRCSSTWRRCCCGGSRTYRSCCLRGVGSESQSGTALCGQSKVHTLGNEQRGLQWWETGGEKKKKRNRRCNIQELNKGLMTFEAEFVFVSQFWKWQQLSRKHLSTYSIQTAKT